MSERSYNMNHEKRGMALVINILTNNPSERVWSVKDVENLKYTLEYLEFDFKLYQNLTKSQIEQEMQEQASIDHLNSDCFLCVVMSHGNEDKIVASDNQEISFEEIMAPIKECASLKDKPKLFFFQAYRDGNQIVYPNNKSVSDSLATNKMTRRSADTDLLVYNVTLTKHYPLGTETDGTVFIKNLCKMLNGAYKELPNNIPISNMIHYVNKSVRDSGIQLTEPVNCLVAEVSFTPKKVS
jgi:caspase 6